MDKLKVFQHVKIILFFTMITSYSFSMVFENFHVPLEKGDDSSVVENTSMDVFVGLSQNVVAYLESQNSAENLSQYLIKYHRIDIEENQAKLLNFAASKYGLSDIAGDSSNSEVLQFFRETGHPEIIDDETSWCSAYLNWCAKNVNLMGCEFSTGLLAKSWLSVGEEVVGEPKTGDIVVFWREKKNSWQGHVSIFINEDPLGHQVFCLGGNQNDKVTLKAYPSEQVLGYRRLNVIVH
jgi:uncharacterized protein (TIGR02594 family)